MMTRVIVIGNIDLIFSSFMSFMLILLSFFIDFSFFLSCLFYSFRDLVIYAASYHGISCLL